MTWLALLYLVVFPVFSYRFDPLVPWTTSFAKGEWSVVPGKEGAAYAIWEETRYTTGWDSLYIYSNAAYSAEDQAFAAGFIEGALLQPLTWASWVNTINATKSDFSEKFQQFLLDNYAWTKETAKLRQDSPYWVQVGLTIAQSDGITAGHNKYAPEDQKISTVDFLAYQATNEWSDILAVTDPEKFSTSARRLGAHCSCMYRVQKKNSRAIRV